MRKRILTLVLVIPLLLPVMATAQGTLELSNLGATPVGSAAIGSDSWIAQGFYTGPNPDGYTLNSVELLMDPASGSPSGFSVSIYDSAVSGYPFTPPGSSIGSLSGFDPSAGGLFSYTASSITLSPSTHYFVVATSTTSVANGAYFWSATGYTSTSPWFLPDPPIFLTSSDGSDWRLSRLPVFQLAIYATPVPEPSTLMLVGLGLAAIGFWRFRQGKGLPRFDFFTKTISTRGR